MAVIEDRKFKSGPAQAVDKKRIRGGLIMYAIQTLILWFWTNRVYIYLGDRQEKFLEEWAGDFRDASMKAILSQSPFVQ